MKHLLCALLLMCMVGCDTNVKIDFGSIPTPVKQRVFDYPTYEEELPTVNLEEIFRQSNWIGSQGEGSCVYATAISLLRWQGEFELADNWPYENGEWATRFAARCDERGIRYAYTSKRNDVNFLEWAIATRRGCGVSVRSGRHMVTLVHLDSKWAGILDNNDTSTITYVPRDTFLNEWMNSSSWAYTILMSPPPPPLPSKEQT